MRAQRRSPVRCGSRARQPGVVPGPSTSRGPEDSRNTIPKRTAVPPRRELRAVLDRLDEVAFPTITFSSSGFSTGTTCSSISPARCPSAVSSFPGFVRLSRRHDRHRDPSRSIRAGRSSRSQCGARAEERDDHLVNPQRSSSTGTATNGSESPTTASMPAPAASLAKARPVRSLRPPRRYSGPDTGAAPSTRTAPALLGARAHLAEQRRRRRRAVRHHSSPVGSSRPMLPVASRGRISPTADRR